LYDRTILICIQKWISLFLFLANPYVTPSSPLLLSPSNRTFSITCSFLCQSSIDLAKLQWLINDEDLFTANYQFLLETITLNSQRLTIFLNKKVSHNFSSANFTCRYQDKQSTILVRRRTSTTEKKNFEISIWFDLF